MKGACLTQIPSQKCYDSIGSLGAFNFTIVDLLLDVLGGLAINSAANGNACAKDFLDSSTELSSVGLGAHFLGDFDDLIHSDFTVVDNVLGLLSVTCGLLECLQDKRASGVEDTDLALLVLDLDLDLNLDTLPLLGGLLDVFTDLLGGHTNGRALGGKGSSGSNFSTDNLHEDVVNRVGVKSSFRGHCILFLPIY